MTFSELGLSKALLDTLDGLNLTTPTPIQVQAIPLVLEGRDVIGLAQTGTGKTAAFALPILHRMAPGKKAAPKKARVLILAPTRELSSQIARSVKDYGRKLHLTSTVVVGGVSIKPQIKALASGVDILIATPGRLMDLIEQRAVSLNEVEVVVLDEADQMLDIGFMPAIKRILAMTPQDRQTLLFSATMPKEIRELSSRHLKNPTEVSVIPAKKTADRVDHTVMHMQTPAKMGALASLIRDRKGERVIVFTRTKRGADKATKRLEADGISAAAIHGNKSQGQRERALAGFRAGTVPVLIATDIAARGIDVPGVSLVVNYELPNVPEVYVHRIGRTARAGAAGTAVTFCAPDERSLLRDIEKMLKVEIQVEKAPEGTYVDALADPDGDFAPLNRTQRPRQGARPQGAKPQGQGRKPAQGQGRGGKPGQGRAPGEGQQAGKPGANRHHPAAAGANQNGDQPAKPRRSRRGSDRRPRPEQGGDKAVA
ncbi:MAG: DEAD/DEAH box helicase [Hoeflea sp.]|uniref:DEAD/DEAH box helicase n=1 Tax=Hoeflea sp. TaxID=1940281 RepID=UPI001E12FDA3|nr:DEAD/DEAH box helicase [Hoeflea sp.]MBU4527285.1 DEAD/DEAH box helicase [Alphaproteobacteria bacterium]MBU4546932.1 DEAD/DEAH box helicase [Alphaproteobacteria bacterium]MBU4551556.1 DEAD/DEAH box helicase [Alphaproteobacteria bacterium]MBV1725561.1 DEAD/DEAH box helicase [Hoeflea sp.]MBV1759609.1 DEAD/DEAH box helicase [Hoeflea sp.]